MQVGLIERHRINAEDYDTTYNNIKIIYNISLLKTFPFKNCVKLNEYKLLLKTLTDFDVNDSEFEQAVGQRVCEVVRRI